MLICVCMNKLKQSFSWAIHGLKTVWREERNFRIEVIIALIVLIFGFLDGLTATKWALVCIAITFVLGAEIINTAIEDICNRIEPKQDPIIGKIKDIMAGFVLIACIGAVLIGFVVFF